MTISQWVCDITEAEFQSEVIERSRSVPIVVDFWADWCTPCKALGPLLETIAEEYDGAFILAKVNTDQCPNLMMALQVQSVPLVIAFRDGQPAQHFQGNLPETEVRAFFEQVLPGVVPGKAAAQPAPDPVSEMTDDEAETHFRARLAENEQENAALLGLSAILLGRGAHEQAAALLERAEPDVDSQDELTRLQALLFLQRAAAPLTDAQARLAADPDNPQRRYEQGTVQVAAGDHEAGLQTLLSAAQLDRELASGKVKELMVQAFYAIGSRSALANEYRQKLTMLLY